MLKRNEGDLNITSADRMVFLNLPLTYEKMILLVPAEIRNPEDKRHRAVFGLIQCMARQLEDARRVSTIPPSQYLQGYKRGQSDVRRSSGSGAYNRKWRRSSSVWRLTISGGLQKRKF